MEPNNILCDDDKIIQQKYLELLTEKERLSYNIAQSHLGMSFSLEKSRGFLEFKKRYVQQQQQNTARLTDRPKK